MSRSNSSRVINGKVKKPIASDSPLDRLIRSTRSNGTAATPKTSSRQDDDDESLASAVAAAAAAAAVKAIFQEKRARASTSAPTASSSPDVDDDIKEEIIDDMDDDVDDEDGEMISSCGVDVYQLHKQFVEGRLPNIDAIKHDVATALPVYYPVDVSTIDKLRKKVPRSCAPLCDYLSGLTHYVNREFSRIQGINKQTKKDNKPASLDALFPFDTSRLSSLPPMFVSMPPFGREIDLVEIASSFHLAIPEPTLTKVVQRFALGIFRLMVPEEERMIFSGCGVSNEHYFIIEDDIVKKLIKILLTATNFDANNVSPVESADVHNRIFLAMREHWTNYLEKIRKDFNRIHGKGAAKQLALDVRRNQMNGNDLLSGLFGSADGEMVDQKEEEPDELVDI